MSFAVVPPPTLPGLPVSGGSIPTPVVFVGHFHDRRVSLCATGTADKCGRILVVDAVAWVDGGMFSLPIHIDWRDSGSPAQTQAQLAAETSFLATHTEVLNTRLASSLNVLNLEPALKGSLPNKGQVPEALTHDPLLWLATVIDSRSDPMGPVARTYIIDSNGVLYVDGGPMFIVVVPTPS